MDHSRSLEIAPFDRANTSSQQPSIVTMSLSCTVSEIQRDIGRKSPIVTYFASIWRPSWGNIVGMERTSLASENQSIQAIVRRCLCHLRFSHLGKLRLVTDRRTDGHTIIAYTALAQHRAVKARAEYVAGKCNVVQCTKLQARSKSVTQNRRSRISYCYLHNYKNGKKKNNIIQELIRR